MEFFLFKSGTWVKIIMVLGSLGIRWLYSYLYFSVSDGSISNEEQDEDEIEDKAPPPIATTPIVRKIVRKPLQTTPQVAAEKPQRSQPASNLLKACKTSLGSKRKLFRNALLMDALMQRKDFIA